MHCTGNKNEASCANAITHIPYFCFRSNLTAVLRNFNSIVLRMFSSSHVRIYTKDSSILQSQLSLHIQHQTYIVVHISLAALTAQYVHLFPGAQCAYTDTYERTA